jgi:hypothetical protein
MSNQTNRRLWSIVLVVAWAMLALLSFGKASLPPSWWFVAGVPEVEDSMQGQCPAVIWDREIRRPFRGKWVATLMRRTPSGRYFSYRPYQGGTDYQTDADLPVPLDLAWWFLIDPRECNWPPGQYRLHTVWTIYPDAGGEKLVRRTSPPFTIHPRSAAP